MKELEYYWRQGRRVELVYLDRCGNLSQREVVLLSVQEGRVLAYCLCKQGIRQFRCENILAVGQVSGRGKKSYRQSLL